VIPRHILMTADTVGGVWTYAIELSRGLSNRGVRVSLATMGAHLSEMQRRQARICGVDIYESTFKLEWMDRPWEEVDAAGEWLLDLENRLQPDLIHLNNFAHGDLPWNAPVVLVAHSCVYSWWNAVHGGPPPREWDEYHRRVTSGLQAADVVVAVSRTMLRELEQWYGFSGAQCAIYNGHQTRMYSPGSKEPFVLSTGRIWDAAKNMTALDSAAELIRCPVYVAGEIQHPEGGRSPMRNANPIGYLGQEELRQWFSRAGIYALPALYEPFGLSVLEAALSGCALVLGDIPSLREIWGDAALFVPPFDHEALAIAVNSLIVRPATREDLARRARARALNFTTDRMVQGYLGIYPQAQATNRSEAEARTSCVS
jgi:glycogen(starch) synthase